MKFIVSQIQLKRRSKDLLTQQGGGDKSKLRDDRKKPNKLKDKDTTNDPDIKGDPDLKKGGFDSERLLVARKLIRMARLMLAWDTSGAFEKTYEVKGDVLTVRIDWSKADDTQFDIDTLYINSADDMSNIQDELMEKGVKKKPDNFDEQSYEPNDSDLTIKFDVSEADPQVYEKLLEDAGFKKK